MTDVDELLRREGERWRATATAPPHVDWALVAGPQRKFSSPWWMVLATAATAAAVVVGALVVPSLVSDRTATPPAAHRPTPSHSLRALGGPASFIALTRAGVTQVDARTGQSRGMSVSEKGLHETALAVTDEGHVGYATYSHPRCQVFVHRYRWTSPTTSTGTDAGIVSGVRADSLAVSPDGHLLALAIHACNRPSATTDDLVVLDLQTHQQRRWTGYPDVSLLSGLQWGPDNRTLAYVVTPCCGGGSEGPRLLDTSAAGTSYVAHAPLSVDETVGSGIVFWFRGQLAVVMGSEIHALGATGAVGPVLARGLPTDVEDVHPDRTGEHLLVTSRDGSLSRWDAGVLTLLAGHWTDAGW